MRNKQIQKGGRKKYWSVQFSPLLLTSLGEISGCTCYLDKKLKGILLNGNVLRSRKW